jgi:AbrB family looped-hinge helix DNA binding protein
MATATVTSKGQITIPASVRSALKLEAGTRVEFIEMDRGRYAIIPASSPVSALKGILRKPKKPATISDMERAIEEGATKGW